MRGISGAGLALAGLVLTATASTTRAEEIVRTIRADLSALPAGSRFSVENLVGTMHVREADVATVTAVATVYAESQSLADAVRFEPVSESDGTGTVLRVRYPYDRVSTFRYREPGDHSDGLWHSFESSSTYHYDGRSVKVNAGRGTWIHTDVEVQIPRGDVTARFLNLVGLVDAEGLRGKLRFEVASADLRIAHLQGDVELEGSSGDIRARDIKGTWKSDFSSGDVRLDGFDGESLELHASSGDFAIRNVKARRIVTETNSGDAKFLDADVEEFAAEATSGDIELEDVGERLKTAEVSTSSGDVTLRLPRDASFDATTRPSSGDTRLGFYDGVSIEQHESQVAYRRGDHGARIRVRTSSGDFSLAPI